MIGFDQPSSEYAVIKKGFRSFETLCYIYLVYIIGFIACMQTYENGKCCKRILFSYLNLFSLALSMKYQITSILSFYGF